MRLRQLTRNWPLLRAPALWPSKNTSVNGVPEKGVALGAVEGTDQGKVKKCGHDSELNHLAPHVDDLRWYLQCSNVAIEMQSAAQGSSLTSFRCLEATLDSTCQKNQSKQIPSSSAFEENAIRPSSGISLSPADSQLGLLLRLRPATGKRCDRYDPF